MDFEEQLEKAEKSPYPSLVGASVKSADDSPHNNYIHPEKYTGVSKQKQKKKSILNSSIGASLDDLISEGALLGSEEDFDKFLDHKGNVLSDAKYTVSEESEKVGKEEDKVGGSEVEGSAKEVGGSEVEGREVEGREVEGSEVEGSEVEGSEKEVGETHNVSKVDLHGNKADSQKTPDNSSKNYTPDEAQKSSKEVTESADHADTASISSPSQSSEEKKEIYSNPNLSEYQIGHQIADHSQLLDSVKSYDLSRLPSTEDTESKSKTSDFHGVPEKTPARPNFARSNSAFANNKTDHGHNVQVLERDSLHSPYFQTNDERSPSRSRARDPIRERSTDRSRSRSRSTMSATHLARGDSYKNTHGDSPIKYELPADMLVDEEEEEEASDERRSRQSKPTLGDSLAAVEAGESPKFAAVDAGSVTKEPSLVTSGDYTNFNAESSESLAYGSDSASVRSESSRNYLRSISRSRSRKPTSHLHHEISEKNDSNTDELTREGALVSDDPYSQVGNLDTMMKQVLLSSSERSRDSRPSSVSEASSKEPNVIPKRVSISEEVKAETDSETLEKEAISLSSNEPVTTSVEKTTEASSNLITESVDAGEKEITMKSEMEPSKTETEVSEESSNPETEASEKSSNPETEVSEESSKTETELSKESSNPETETSEKSSNPETETSEKSSNPETEISEKSSNPETETYESSNPETQPSDSIKPVVDDVSAEQKVAETEKQVHTEEAPKVTASDINVDKDIAHKATESETVLDTPEIEEQSEAVVESSAEVLEKDASSQLRTDEAPVVTASDIKTGLTKEEDEKEENSDEAVEGSDINTVSTATDDHKDDSEVEEKSKNEAEARETAETGEVKDETSAEDVDKAESEVADQAESEVTDQAESEVTDQAESEVTDKHDSEVTDSIEKTDKDDSEVTDSIEKTDKDDSEVTDSIEKTDKDDSEVTDSIEKTDQTESEVTDSIQKTDQAESEVTDSIDKTTDSTDREVTDSIQKTDQAESEVADSIQKTTESTDQDVTDNQDPKQNDEKAIESEPVSAISSIAGAVLGAVGAAKDILPGQDSAKNEVAQKKPEESDDLDISVDELRAHLKSLPVYIFTSLAGGMQIVNRTNRLVTILQANKVKFEYRDLGTDEDAKKLWRRYAQGKTLPGVVRGDDFIGNWEYIDEVNEDYRLHEVLYETL